MIAVRILLGLLKGALVGGGIGAGFWALDQDGTTLAWLRWPVYGAVGFFTGLVAGKAPWAGGAAWVASILKAVVGFGLGVGLFFLVDYLVTYQVYGRPLTMWPFAFGAAVGIVYGIWVEVDDGGKSDDASKQLKGKPETKALPPGDDDPAE